MMDPAMIDAWNRVMHQLPALSEDTVVQLVNLLAADSQRGQAAVAANIVGLLALAHLMAEATGLREPYHFIDEQIAELRRRYAVLTQREHEA